MHLRNFLGGLTEKIHQKIWYNALFAILSIASVIFLIYELFIPGASSELVSVFVALDLAIAYIFLADFVLGFLFSRYRAKYIRENWINFFASIPVSSDVYRILRIIRFARAVRAIRTVVSAERALAAVRKNGS